MRYSALFKNIFLSGLETDSYAPITRKLILLNILLVLSSLILLFFAFYNLFFDKASLGIIDVAGLIGAIYAFVHLRLYKTIAIPAFIATFTIFTFMITLVYIAEGKDFTLVWTVFLPIFAIFINGSRKGLLITMLFYIIVFSISYQGIGVWQNGAWSEAGFLRLVFASMGLTFITYFFERSFESAYRELERQRDTEQKHIKELELASITDPLTQLYNRRYLNEQFSKRYVVAKERGEHFAFFILDLDYFKKYNDAYGHMAGDEVLQKVAAVLKESMRREADSICRFGGEEFCGIMISDSQEKIVKNIEKMREAIEELGIKHSQSEHNVVTASFGISIVENFQEKDLEKVYKSADDALYRAKANGRNCIEGVDLLSAV